MSEHYYISDHHFGHENILKWSDRPANTLREMHDWLIDAHNSVVGDKDSVTFLGDFAHNRDRAMMVKGLGEVTRLNGKYKHLILGNHDTLDMLYYKEYFDSVQIVKYKSFRTDRLCISHIPVHPIESTFGDKSRWTRNLHGHLHESEIEDYRYINVNVDVAGPRPKTLEELCCE